MRSAKRARAVEHWAVEQWNCILWSDGAPSIIFGMSWSDPELTIQHLTSLMLNHILIVMFQHLELSLPTRVEAVTAAKGAKLRINSLEFRRKVSTNW